MHKLTQETQDNWIKVLPIALMRAMKKGGTVLLWMYLWKDFLKQDIVIDPEALELTNYVTQLSVFQEILWKFREVTPDPASESNKPLS